MTGMKRFTPRRAMWAVTLAAVSMAAYVNVDVGSNDAGSFFLLHSVGFTAAVTSITFLLTDNSGAR